MKSNAALVNIVVFLALTLSGCEVIGDIFQAGMVIGIIVVVAIIALVLWILRKFRK